MNQLLPLSARIDGAILTLGGIATTDLCEEFGTPLVVYCDETLRAQARAYRSVESDALVVYATKAFTNVAMLRLFADEGLGADVSTLGELQFALRAGIPPAHLVFHGNNKSDAELEAAAALDVLVVLDSLEEVERAAAAGARRALIRLTPGIDAQTHRSIQTGQVESKFGLDAAQALEAAVAAVARFDLAGLHMHVGSQLTSTDASVAAVDRLAEFCAVARDDLGWLPRIVDLGGGLAVQQTRDEAAPEIPSFAGAVVRRLRDRIGSSAQLILEPGRSLVGRAGVSLYRIGTTKRSGSVEHVAVDGGMSDNPRPQLYGARYQPLLANRGDESPDGRYRIVGKHCENGDVLVEAAQLPRPRRGDVLAVPATGAYTLSMASTYNAVPRPAVVLVANGDVRLIRRRETIDDLLAFDVFDGRCEEVRVKVRRTFTSFARGPFQAAPGEAAR
jgi:diaminopimelate decarboxylase